MNEGWIATLSERVGAETDNTVLFRVDGEETSAMTADQRAAYDAVREMLDGAGIEVEELSEAQMDALAEQAGVAVEARRRSGQAEERDGMNHAIDEATSIVTGRSVGEERRRRLQREQERRDLAREIYGNVLQGNFNDVTLQQINKYIDEATPENPFGRRISQRVPQRMERALQGGHRTNAVDALFSRISESERPEAGAQLEGNRGARARAKEKKKELLRGWAIATGNWHTDIRDFTDDAEPIAEGKDSKVYRSKDGQHVIKFSKGKESGKFPSDIDAANLFGYVFPSTSYDIVGYGEIDGEFVTILQQPMVDVSSALTEQERVEYMRSMGFEPINKENTAFSNGQIVVADLQKGNIVRSANGVIQVIDADVKLHTRDIGGQYSYPPASVDTERRLQGEDKPVLLKDGRGVVYGAAMGGRIYLNGTRLNPNTPIHEYTHLWDDACRLNNPELWKQGVELMKGTSLWNEVRNDPAYAHLQTDDEIASEVHARLTGKDGAALLERLAKEAREAKGGVFAKAEQITLVERLKRWLSDFWAWMKDTMTPWTAEEAARVTLEDFVRMPLMDLVKGTRLNGVQDNSRAQLQFIGEEGASRLDAAEEERAIEAEAKRNGTWLKAPNGKPTRLSPRQWVQVRTRAFKRWFGDWENDAENASKVVDENGEPLVVYHGSREGGFSVFDDTMGEKQSGAPEGTTFFSSERSVAYSYSGSNDSPTYEREEDEDGYVDDEAHPSIYECFLNIRQPYYEDFEGADWQGDAYGKYELYDAEGGETVFNPNGGRYFDSYDEAEEYADEQGLEEYDIRENPYIGYSVNDVASDARGNGADGAIVSRIVDEGRYGYGNEATDYVVFSPNQIKSATDNVGVFDASNDDIRYREGDSELEEVNARFNEQVQQWSDGELPASEYVRVGNPMGALQQFMPDVPVIVRQKVLTKSRKKHGLDASDMRNLPMALANPIFVFEGKSGTINVLTELSDKNGENIFVAIELGTTKQMGHQTIEVNDILTIHGREVENVVEPIVDNNSLLWADKEKGLNWLSSAKSKSQAIANEVLESATKVVENFENPKFEDENLTGGELNDLFRRSFGGNSGYVGYSKSKRAVAAEHRGLRNKSQMDGEFAEEVNAIIAERGGERVTLAAIKRATEHVRADEWHHTSKFGNRTNYYSAETLADYFAPESSEETGTDSQEAARTRLREAEAALNAYVREQLMNTTVETPVGEMKGFRTSDGLVAEVVNVPLWGRAQDVRFIRTGAGGDMFVSRYSDEWYENAARYESAAEEYAARLEDVLAKAPQALKDELEAARAEVADIRRREGSGAPGDDALSEANDPTSKMAGGYRTAAQRRAFAERVRSHMVRALEEWVGKLHLENVDIVTDVSVLEGRRARAKGFYDKRTGRITIVVPNHGSVSDVIETLLHEAVAHYGLRQLFGDRFDTFLDNVFAAADADVRGRIVEMARRRGWDFRTATEEYLAGLAERTDFERATERGWWQQIRRMFLKMLGALGLDGFGGGVRLSDNELRYILWRSYENLAEPGRYRNVFAEAKDVAKQLELRVGNYGVSRAQASMAGERGTTGEEPSRNEDVLEEVNARFNDQLGKLTEENADRTTLWLGRPSAILRAAGVRDMPMKLYGNKVIKKMKKHGFTLDGLMDLPLAVADPIAVFDNYQREGNRSILTELQVGDKNILVSITIGKDGVDADFNIVSSVFGKGGQNIVDWLNKGYATYINKEKALRYLNFSKSSILEASKSGELDDATKVVETFENPKLLEDEDVLMRDGDPEVHERVLARDRYDARIKNGWYQSRESVQDSMLSLKEGMRLVLGDDMRIEEVAGFENAYLGENRLSSVNKAEADAFARLLFKPMLDEVARLAPTELSRERLVRYMMCKHGLERNVYMAHREAEAKLADILSKIEKQLAEEMLTEDERKALLGRIELEKAKYYGVERTLPAEEAQAWYERLTNQAFALSPLWSVSICECLMCILHLPTAVPRT